jgi:hypothetical protein
MNQGEKKYSQLCFEPQNKVVGISEYKKSELERGLRVKITLALIGLFDVAKKTRSN